MQELGTYIFTPIEKEGAEKRGYIDVNRPNFNNKKVKLCELEP
jgi:hypothetical protein